MIQGMGVILKNINYNLYLGVSNNEKKMYNFRQDTIELLCKIINKRNNRSLYTNKVSIINQHFHKQKFPNRFTYTFENDIIDIGIQDFVGCLPNFHSIGQKGGLRL